MRTPASQIVRVWDYKQKKNLVITFLHSGCARCAEFLEGLAGRAAVLDAAEAAALVVLSEPPSAGLAQRLPANVILGTDCSGRSQRAYLGEDPFGTAGQRLLGVFVADRYGELHAAWVVRDEDELPAAETVLSWLRQIEVACDECGVSEWPVEP